MVIICSVLVEEIMAQAKKANMNIRIDSDKYSHLNVYLGDCYSLIPDSAHPFAIIPIKDHKSSYETELNKMTLVGVRGVDAAGMMDEKIATVLPDKEG